MDSELAELIKQGNIETLKKGLEQSKFQQFLHRSIFEGDFPLHLAAKARNEKIVNLLLEAGANVNQGSEVQGSHRGYTAAHEAAGNGDVDILKVLQNHGVDFNRCSDDHWYPLHCAVYKGKQNCITFLLENGANVDCETAHHQTPLCFAVSHGRVRDVRFLLRNKARVDMNDLNQDTLMHHAFHYRMSKLFEGEYDVPEAQLDVAIVLALNGVNPCTVNNEQEEPTIFIREDLPSLERVLSMVYNYASQLKNFPIEWNYLSLLNTKSATLQSLGMTPSDGVTFCEMMQAVEKERTESQARKLAERPQGGCPVMRGKRKKGGDDAAAAPVSSGADPSGGKCPFFQKKENASGEAPPPLPAGHPAVPAEMANVAGADPSGGKCPFFQKRDAPKATERTGPAAELPPVCPFSATFVKRHTTMLLMLGFSFMLGMWMDQMLNRIFS